MSLLSSAVSLSCLCHGWDTWAGFNPWHQDSAHIAWDLRPDSLLSSASPLSPAFVLGSHGHSREAAQAGQAGERCCRGRGNCGGWGVSHFHSGPAAPAAAGSPMLPAEGPCRKPAGNRMVSRERKKKPILSQTGAFISTLVHSFKGQLPHRESVCMFEVRRPFLGLWNWVREGLVPSSRGAPLPAPLHGPASFSYAGWPSGKGDVAKKHQTWPPLG